MPPISLVKEKQGWEQVAYDWGPWIFAFALVVIGVGQVWLSYGTLAVTRQVADATQVAAEAARLSAQMLEGVTAPRLLISEFKVPRRSGSIRGILSNPHVAITLKNYGQSPALLQSCSIELTCEDQPGPYGKPVNFNTGIAIAPGGAYRIGEEHGADSIEMGQVADRDVDALIDGRKQMTIYGWVRYSDVFGRPPRELKFSKTLADFGAESNWDPLIVDTPYTSSTSPQTRNQPTRRRRGSRASPAAPVRRAHAASACPPVLGNCGKCHRETPSPVRETAFQKFCNRHGYMYESSERTCYGKLGEAKGT